MRDALRLVDSRHSADSALEQHTIVEGYDKAHSEAAFVRRAIVLDAF